MRQLETSRRLFEPVHIASTRSAVVRRSRCSLLRSRTCVAFCARPLAHGRHPRYLCTSDRDRHSRLEHHRRGCDGHTRPYGRRRARWGAEDGQEGGEDLCDGQERLVLLVIHFVKALSRNGGILGRSRPVDTCSTGHTRLDASSGAFACARSQPDLFPHPHIIFGFGVDCSAADISTTPAKRSVCRQTTFEGPGEGIRAYVSSQRGQTAGHEEGYRHQARSHGSGTSDYTAGNL
jgi:hypothetical protein